MALTVQDEIIIKHEVSVNILPFDVIADAKPILSSLCIFVDSIPDELKASSSSASIGKPAKSIEKQDNVTSIMTLPLLTVHCDSVRVILPVREACKANIDKSIDNTESVFVFHFHSVDLSSSPCNPITKTVTDKQMYRQMKQCYRDPLKKLKVWNIQYQISIMNVGLCTTNWRSLESGLPGKQKLFQNPALEWNSQPE